MPRTMGAVNRHPTEQSIRILRRILRGTMLLPAAAGFLGGILVSILVATGGSRAILVLAVASGLGATVIWWLRGAQDRRSQRAVRERLKRRIHRARRARRNQRTTAEVEPGTVGSAEPDPSSEDFVVFHDFNAAQGHFDHW